MHVHGICRWEFCIALVKRKMVLFPASGMVPGSRDLVWESWRYAQSKSAVLLQWCVFLISELIPYPNHLIVGIVWLCKQRHTYKH
jgi:hypothetical protein